MKRRVERRRTVATSPVRPRADWLLAAIALGVSTVATVACSGCPGVSGNAEEVPVEIEWPDASTVGPVQPIDPTAAPPPPVLNKDQAEAGDDDSQAESDTGDDGSARGADD